MRTNAARRRVEPQTIGAKIRELRQAKNMSQRALAEAVGVDHTYVCHLEAGRRIKVPGVARLVLFAQALETELDTLLPR